MIDALYKFLVKGFFISIHEFGFDAATTLNFAVVKSFGKTEIKRLMTDLGYGEIKNNDDLKALFEIGVDLYFPEEHKCEIQIIDKDTLATEFHECYVHRMTCEAGTKEIHQCAAKTRATAWLAACGLNGEVINEKNTDNCDGVCKTIFKIEW